MQNNAATLYRRGLLRAEGVKIQTCFRPGMQCGMLRPIRLLKNANTVTAFDRDAMTGRLSARDEVLSVGSPVCIVFKALD